MKKLLTDLLTISVILVCFAGCDGTAPPIDHMEDDNPYVVETKFQGDNLAKEIYDNDKLFLCFIFP